MMKRIGDGFLPIIIDLGSCQPIKMTVKSREHAIELKHEFEKISSAPYRPPELYEVPYPFERKNIEFEIVDGRCDVWSLGCVFYYILTGDTLFEDEYGIKTIAIMNGTIELPKELEYTKNIDILLRKMVKVDMGKRYKLKKIIEKIQILSSFY